MTRFHLLLQLIPPLKLFNICETRSGAQAQLSKTTEVSFRCRGLKTVVCTIGDTHLGLAFPVWERFSRDAGPTPPTA